MSQATFQSMMARLVIDPLWRKTVCRSGLDADADLTPLERRRLLAIAHSAGLDTNQMLHRGFRLGKLKALLPMTCRLLQGPALQAATTDFWAEHPPTSFYFLPEAIAFCSFLLDQPPRGAYLHEVAAFERAHLELQRARTDAPPAQEVRFVHHPSQLLGPLALGRLPEAVSAQACVARGVLDASGQPKWTISA